MITFARLGPPHRTVVDVGPLIERAIADVEPELQGRAIHVQSAVPASARFAADPEQLGYALRNLLTGVVREVPPEHAVQLDASANGVVPCAAAAGEAAERLRRPVKEDDHSPIRPCCPLLPAGARGAQARSRSCRRSRTRPRSRSSADAQRPRSKVVEDAVENTLKLRAGLIVDDEVGVRESRMALRTLRHEHGRLAPRRSRRSLPAASTVLLDIIMPGMDGMQVLESSAPPTHCRLSADGDKHLRCGRGQGLGAFHYIATVQ